LRNKTTSIFLLILFAYNAAGIFVIFKLKQIEVKEEATEKIASNLHDNELEIFTINIEEFKNGGSNIIWEEKGKEFRYEDKLYDVVRIKYADGKIQLFCLNDKKEENIIESFSNSLHKNLSLDNKLLNILAKIPGYFYQDISYRLPLLTGKSFQLSTNFTYKSVVVKILTPPPRL